jgi:hypothetical protein
MLVLPGKLSFLTIIESYQRKYKSKLEQNQAKKNEGDLHLVQ